MATELQQKARFKAVSDRSLSKPVAVALPPEVDAWVRSLPNRSQWLRNAIAKAYQEELENQASN